MSAGTYIRDPKDTIVAIASVLRPGSRGIVRITGPKTVSVLSSLGFPAETKQWLTDCKQAGQTKTFLNQVLFAQSDNSNTIPVDLWYWPDQRTYTGQASAELHVEGIPVLLDSLLQCLLDGGARAAGPGEYTMRAFLAGRLDLVQAEAVLGVIHADNPDQLKLGLQRLGGGLSTPLEHLRNELILLLSDLEAGLDFVEEDIEFVSNEKLVRDLENVQLSVRSLLEKVRQRTGHQEKPVVSLVGPPNAGKSSLFNLLCDSQPQAIVSGKAGTTRDFVSADVSSGPIPFRLVDTAGIEDLDFTSKEIPAAPNNIDQMAWKQSWQSVQQCDLVLFCWSSESAAKFQPEFDKKVGVVERESNDQSIEGLPFRQWLGRLPSDRTKVLLTKSDLASLQDFDAEKIAIQEVSSHSGAGVLELKEMIQETLQEKSGRHVDPDGLLGPRATEALNAIETSVNSGLELARIRVGEELIAMELHCAVDELGKLVGTIYTDDLLDSIFSRFCIGK